MAEKIQVVFPYCGGGCMLNLIVDNGTILGAEPAPERINQSELCLKEHFRVIRGIQGLSITADIT
jgi:predicted molibdopterin-dependent oxidoreductase YjgC